MATQTKAPHTPPKPQKTSEAKQTAEKGVKSLQAFWTKCTNDWVMNFAPGLAFNLITAIFPIAIACAGYLGHLFQKRALTMAQPFFFFTMYASVGDVKVSCSMCLLPDF